MRWLGTLLIILATMALARAEDWTTADGKTYKNVTIVSQEGDGVRVTYDGGVGKIPYYELDDDLLRRLGQDPVAMALKRVAALKAQAAAILQSKQDAAAEAEIKKQKAEADAIAAALQANQPQPQNTAPGPAGVPGQTTSPGQAPAGASSGSPAAASGNSSSAQNPAPGQSPAGASAPTPASGATPGATSAQNSAQPAPAPAPPNSPPAMPLFPAQPAVTSAPADAATSAGSSSESDEQQSSYPNSKFQYNQIADVSYLDSPVIAVEPIALDATVAAGGTPGQNGSLYLRIVTEGTRAEAPDEVQGVFVSPTPLPTLATERLIKFLVDGKYVTGSPPIEAPASSETTPDLDAVKQVTFFLTPEQMRTVLSGKKVNFSVGKRDYMIGDAGLATFRNFLGDVTHLPPASANLTRAYHRFLTRLPSIITMISTTCEYIILSAFGIVVVASIAAFVMGLTRFIKM